LSNSTPDRKAIGGIQNEVTVFQNQTIELPAGSLIYMGSDGYIDQNNEKRARLGEKKLKELLNQNQNQPLSDQKQLLETELANQMLNTSQRDDILLLGFRL
jgi:serine phosphatase RsbU (regulator of sigma subunit)